MEERRAKSALAAVSRSKQELTSARKLAAAKRLNAKKAAVKRLRKSPASAK